MKTSLTPSIQMIFMLDMAVGRLRNRAMFLFSLYKNHLGSLPKCSGGFLVLGGVMGIVSMALPPTELAYLLVRMDVGRRGWGYCVTWFGY